MSKLVQRPLPENPMARVRLMAKELAEGASEGIWGTQLGIFRGSLAGEKFLEYLEQRWGKQAPGLGLLVSNGYLTEVDSQNVLLTKSAFELLSEVEPASI